MNPIGWASKLFQGVVKSTGDLATAAVTPVASAVGGVARKIVGADNADKLGNDYLGPNSADKAVGKYLSSPDIAEGLGAVANVANLAGTVVAGKSGLEGLGDLSTAVSEGTLPKPVQSGLDLAKEKIAPTPTATDVTGKITQANTPSDLSSSQRALTSIDTTGVKTYEDLSSKIQDKLNENRTAVDTKLSENTTKFKPSDTTEAIPVNGGAPVTTNPVADSLGQLEKFYEKTNSPSDIARIKNLQSKFETDGLTTKDINNIAREHGSVLNAYNANNELASGLSRQAAENTRQALKQLVRTNTPGDTTNAFDKNTTDLIKTKDMVDEMSKKVQQVENKIRSSGVLQKAGTIVGKALDFTSQGFLRGFLRSVTGLQGPGSGMNAIELQNALSKNLDMLNRLNGMTPSQLSQAIETAANGGVIIPPSKSQ